MARLKAVTQLTNQLFDRMFPNEEACKAYLVARRWPDGVRCPRCGNLDVYPVKNRPFHWQCSKCAAAGGYRFSVLVGTIFENTNKPLREWFKVIHLMLTSKKGISALQVKRVWGSAPMKPRFTCAIASALASASTSPTSSAELSRWMKLYRREGQE